jgi:long-chain fatty acid transport protein
MKACGLAVLGVVWGILLPALAQATNGMNMEGYGPIATGLGGASMAVENGTAALMGNPATLGMMEEGGRLDLAFGRLGPDVTATVDMGPSGRATAQSDGDAYYMPALGVVLRRGPFGFGIGAFAQGGMGTEYAGNTWLGDPSQGQNSALTRGLTNRSELGVGRVLFPLTYNLTETLTIGGTFDFVWASLDLQMAMSEAQFVNMADPRAQTIGRVSGTLADAFGLRYEPLGGSGISRLYHANFDFSNDNRFTGEATGTGVGAKLGVVYQFLPQFVTFGFSWHSKTALGDLETEDATLGMGVNIDTGIAQGQPATGTYMDAILPVSGKLSVIDFQWPQAFAFGIALQPIDQFLLAFDVRRIAWSGVLDDFRLRFTADEVAANGEFAGRELSATLFQDWKDQTVIALGGEYRVGEPLVVRAGYNSGQNPIPDRNLNALFPAIVEKHLTLGLGYEFLEVHRLDASIAFGLEKEATNAGFGTAGQPNYSPPVISTHQQANFQLLYGLRF